jgi:hypothetical protein
MMSAKAVYELSEQRQCTRIFVIVIDTFTMTVVSETSVPAEFIGLQITGKSATMNRGLAIGNWPKNAVVAMNEIW